MTSKLRKKRWLGVDGEESIPGGGKKNIGKHPRAEREPLIRELKLICQLVF